MLEMIVALTLLSVLTVGFFMALRVGLNAMEHSSTRFDENRRVASVQNILERQVAGIVPVMAVCEGPKLPVFDGSPGAMRMVSTHSLNGAGRGYPQLLEYLVVPGVAGGVRLVVNETPYAGPGMIRGLCAAPSSQRLLLRPPVQGPGSFVLADRLASVSFQYLYENPARRQREWAPQWIPRPGSAMPAAIRIDIRSLGTEPAHLKLSPMTMRVRVNRVAATEYDYNDVEQQTQLIWWWK
jgi:hypothetical protein